jgi:hypothetical protein
MRFSYLVATMIGIGAFLGVLALGTVLRRPDVEPSFPHVDLGSEADGRGVLLEEASKRVRKAGNAGSSNGYILMAVGDCNHCSTLSVDSMPTTDEKGRFIIMMTTDKAGYLRARDELHKVIILDSSGKISKQIRVVTTPRQYLLSSDCRVQVAQTGDPITDEHNGFTKL